MTYESPEKISMRKFLTSLEAEIRKTENETEQVEQLDRLKTMWMAYDGEDRIISTADLAQEIAERGPEYKIKTGIPGLDALLDGFRLQQLVVLSAKTKS